MVLSINKLDILGIQPSLRLQRVNPAPFASAKERKKTPPLENNQPCQH
jgi:hypothetical protein